MPPRVQRRWSTRFGRFVSRYGVAELARALEMRGEPTTPSAVYAWLSGLGTPRLSKVIALSAISRGKVTLSVVAEHVACVKNPCAATEADSTQA